MSSPQPLSFYVPSLGQMLTWDSDRGGYFVDPGVLPDELWLVELSRAGLLPPPLTSDEDRPPLRDGDLVPVIGVLRYRESPTSAGSTVRLFAEGPRHAASSGVFRVEIGGEYNPVDPRGAHGPEWPRQL